MEKSLVLYKVINGEATAFPSEAEQLHLSGFTYTAARMGGAPTITGTVKSLTNLEGQWDDVFVTFNQERFYVRTEPDNAKDNTEFLESYDITFYSQRYELDNVYMIDAVQSDSSIDGYQSNCTKVQFMGDITEWVARLNASFGYSGLASEGWSVVIDSGITSGDELVSFEDKFISEALQEGFNVYNIPYYFVGKVIHFGYTANVITTPFEYGVANSLLSIQKNNANYKLVNRCSGYGSSDNLPYYYPNTSPKGTVTAEAASTNTTLQTSHIAVFNAERFANKVAVTDTICYLKPTLTFSDRQVELYNSSTGAYEYTAPSTATVSQLRQKSAYVAYIPMKIVVTANTTAKYKILSPVRINSVLKSLSNLHAVTLDGSDVTNEVTLSASDSSFEIFLAAGSHTIYYTVVASIYYDESYLARIINVTWSSDGEASWYQGTTKIADLSTLGVRVSVTPASGDSFHQTVVAGSYIAPVDTLMPPIFRSSGGINRFYNALNNTYQKPDGSGYYSFNNPYEAGDRREQIVSFEDIKPTIEGMVNASNQVMNKFLAFAWDTDDNDEIDPDTGNYVHPYFFAKLPKFDGENGFNLFDCSSESGVMTIAMKSGVCGACEFEIHVGEDTQKNIVQVDSDGNLLRNGKGEVRCGCESLGQPKEMPQNRQNDTKNYEVWVALAKDTATYPTVMPSHQRGLDPTTDDTFVILNIVLPQAYITAAEERLRQQIIAYMALNNDEKFSFSIAFSRIYFEENPTVLAQLNENARILVRHHDINYTFYISNFTYSMKEGDVLPDINVDLVDELTTSSNSLQQKIDAVKQDLLDTIGGNDILKTGLKYFLRKDVEDYAQKKIYFLEGAEFGSFTTGILGAGGAILLDANGNSYAEFDYLTVRKKAIFREVEVDKIQAVGGSVLVSPASMVISSVEEHSGYYRCYFDTEGDDGQTIENTFALGDFARCQTFNLTTTKYYWRQVVGIGANYIDLSRVSGQYDTGSDAPTTGDNVTSLGNAFETDRRAAIVISAYGTDSPSIKMYHDISTFSLVDKDMFGIMYDVESHRPHLYNYGSMYFGQRDGLSNYISYNGEVLKICAKVEFTSGSSGLSNLNEWNTIDARITRATNAADTVTAAIANINSDEVFTVSEKLAVRSEWEAINGVASTTETGTTGSYYMTRNDFDTIAWSGSPLVFIYNGVTYTYEQRALVYELVGINEMDAAYTTLRNYLDSMELYTNTDTTGFSRSSLATKLTAMYDSERKVYNCVAQDTKTKADDSVTTANAVRTKMESWVADGVISPLELIEIEGEKTFVESDFTELIESCTQLTISYTTLQTKYNTYIDDLDAIINATPDTNGNRSIPDNFAAHQSDYYGERTGILEAIAAALKSDIDNAQGDADAANDKIDSWAADGVISPLEMLQVKDEKNFVVSDYDFCIKNATLYGIDYSTFTDAESAYLADLNAIISATSDEQGNVPIPTGFRTHADTYYTERTALLAAVSVAIDDKYDTIDADINDAQGNAKSAKEVADKASGRMDTWLADGVFSKAELREVRQERNFIISDNAEIVYDATKYKLTSASEYAVYVAAYDAYYADINSALSGTGAYAPDGDGNVAVPSDFTTHSSTYYTARTNMLKAIYDAIKAILDSKTNASDIKYLTDAFTGTTAYASGGLFLAQLVGVRRSDATENVLAGMNGSTSQSLGYDSAHGILTFFAGVPSYSGDAFTKNLLTSELSYWNSFTENLKIDSSKKTTLQSRRRAKNAQHADLTEAATELGVAIPSAYTAAYNAYMSLMASVLSATLDSDGYATITDYETAPTQINENSVSSNSISDIVTTYCTQRDSLIDSIMSFSTRMPNATFRVYEDGYVYANHLIADGATLTTANISGKITSSEGTIGGFTIDSNRIYYTPPEGKEANGFVSLYNDGITFSNTSPNAFGSKIVFSVGTDVVSLGRSAALYLSNYETSGSSLDSPSGMMVSVTASNALDTYAMIVGASGGANKNYAIYCDEGVYAGFRPATKVRSTAYTLTDMDNVVVCSNSSEITFTLPSSPKDGQFYMIPHTCSTKLNVASTSSHPICRFTQSSVSWGETYSSTSPETLMLWYSGSAQTTYNSGTKTGLWFLTYLKTTS